MKNKLYVVDIVIKTVISAPSKEEAEKFALHIAPKGDNVEAHGQRFYDCPKGWTTDSVAYGKGLPKTIKEHLEEDIENFKIKNKTTKNEMREVEVKLYNNLDFYINSCGFIYDNRSMNYDIPTSAQKAVFEKAVNSTPKIKVLTVSEDCRLIETFNKEIPNYFRESESLLWLRTKSPDKEHAYDYTIWVKNNNHWHPENVYWNVEVQNE